MNLGDLLFMFRGDSVQLEADAKAGGAKAGDAGAKSFGDSFKKGVKVVGGALAAGLTVALVGRFAALESATASFRQETGATAEEAARASEAINDMAGGNVQSVEEIGQALTKVHTDLGLTGTEAEKATEQFLKFATASRQDASGAVLAFDDILDAWGLTAASSGDIMDKLVLSHQKYGGSIEENQAALSDLAPAMRAANLTYDDGIGLLNLFAASGLDASSASTAMTKALTKVKSPEELQKLIDDITATEDPLKRVAKAADLFGVRAGAKLANALANGGMDDFKVSTEEAAGATVKAADASLTMVDRIKLAFSGFVSGTVDLLGPAGPLLTAVGSLGTLFAPALSKVFDGLLKAGSPIIKGLVSLGASMGDTIGAAMGPRIAVALGTEIAVGSLGVTALAAAGVLIAIPAILVLQQDIGKENFVAEQKRILTEQETTALAVATQMKGDLSKLTDEARGDIFVMAYAWQEGTAQAIADGGTLADAVQWLKDSYFMTDEEIAQLRADGIAAGKAQADGVAEGIDLSKYDLSGLMKPWEDAVHAFVGTDLKDFQKAWFDLFKGGGTATEVDARVKAFVETNFDYISKNFKSFPATLQKVVGYAMNSLGYGSVVDFGKGMEAGLGRLRFPNLLDRFAPVLDQETTDRIGGGVAAISEFYASLAPTIKGTLEAAKQETLAGMAELKYAINHPFEDQKFVQFLGKQITEAQRLMHKAQREGDTEGVRLAKAEIRRLHAEQREMSTHILSDRMKNAQDKLAAKLNAGGDVTKVGSPAYEAYQLVKKLNAQWYKLQGFDLSVTYKTNSSGSPDERGSQSTTPTKGLTAVGGLGLTAPVSLVPSMGSMGALNSRQDVYHHISAEGARNLRSAGFDDAGVASLLRAQADAGSRYVSPRR